VRALQHQLIVPRRSRFPEPPKKPRLTRLHAFVLGAIAGASVMLLRSGPGPSPGPGPETTKTPAEPVAAEAPIETPFPIYGPPAPILFEGSLRPNQFIADVLAEAGATAVETDRAVHALKGIFDFRTAKPGQRYLIELDDAGNILMFEFQAGPAEVYQVARKDGDLVGAKREVPQQKEVVEVRGSIEHSLYEAFVKAGESESLAMSFAEAFRYDVDFFQDTQSGDAFRVFVEKITNAEGELIGYGQLLAAEYTGAIGTKRLYWFDGAYYDENGVAAKRAFLRSPLSFTRVSSGFGFRRHPVHGRRHFHGGIDYAAPIGTPVHAVAEGVVSYAGNKGANGNMIVIRHPGGIESYYLHLSKLGVRRGERVSQSTVIGKVGSTGRSTGPHLDFRIKKNGQYLDPSKQVAPRVLAVAKKDRERFSAAIGEWRQRFDTSKRSAQRAKRAEAGASA
jgi:murein DD-endopeptidase MepM/ murein hydrolase activator NlpD